MGRKNCINNGLLGHLPLAEFKPLAPHIEEVDLIPGQVVYEPGEIRKFAYFPSRGIISVIQPLENGASSEIALIGRLGMVGMTAVLGGLTLPNRILVQGAGRAYRLASEVLVKQARKGGVLMSLLLLHMQDLFNQVAQSAVCNRHHNLQQQLCRWLLLSLDCMDSEELILTQELIAGILGVRREGVTRAARRLQEQHIIEYHRGVIRILDRQRLEQKSCECYRTITNETRRLQAIQATLVK